MRRVRGVYEACKRRVREAPALTVERGVAKASGASGHHISAAVRPRRSCEMGVQEDVGR